MVREAYGGASSQPSIGAPGLSGSQSGASGMGRLVSGAGGSQTFVPPANFNLAGDLALARGGTNVALPSVRPLGAPRIFGPTAVKGTDGLYWVKLEWDDLRGGFRQYGSAEEVMHNSAVNEFVCDDKGIARHPFIINSQATPDPGAGLRQMTHANVFETLVMSLGDEKLFRETSSTDPTVIEVAGFAVPGSNTKITSTRRIRVNGTEYLAICYFVSGGGANTLQWLSDLNNPPTSGTIAVGTSATWDVIQPPVNGDALLVLNGTSVTRASAAATAIGALAFTTIETVPAGGHWIGLMGTGVGVGTPSVAGLFPVGATGPIRPDTEPVSVTPSNKGKILIFQTAGQLLGELTTKTPYVTLATKFADGLVYCDQASHYYWDGRNHIPMFNSQDRFPDSNYVRKCQGHHVKGDKFYWNEDIVKSPSGTGNTVHLRMEYDLYTNTSRQVSRSVTYSTTGPLTYGGSDMAVSQQTDNLHQYANGSWYRQYQSPAAVRGYDQRKIVGAAAGTGQEYEATAQWISAAVEITGFENAAKVVNSVTGPLSNSLAAGGTDARMDVSVTGQALFSFHQQAKNRRLLKRFPLGVNSAFRGPVNIGVVSYRATTGTDPTRYTTNILPISLSMFMYQRGEEFPTSYGDWDKQGDANG